MDDRERAFEGRMGRTATSMRYPATPDIRAAVLARIEQPARAPQAKPRDEARWRWPTLPRPALAAVSSVGALVVAFGAALAVPTSRDAIAEFFGIEGSKVERLPTPAPGVTPTPLPTPVDIQAFAEPSSLDDASGLAGFPLALPEGAGQPDAVYVVEANAYIPILHYEDFDLWQVQLDEGEAFGKLLPSGTTLQELTVSGVPARWVSGGSHLVTFIDRNGREIVASQRTVDRNTLIWRTEFAFYRLETDLPLADAVQVAESLP